MTEKPAASDNEVIADAGWRPAAGIGDRTFRANATPKLKEALERQGIAFEVLAGTHNSICNTIGNLGYIGNFPEEIAVSMETYKEKIKGRS